MIVVVVEALLILGSYHWRCPLLWALAPAAYVRTLDLRVKRSRVRISAVSLSGNNLGQVVHTRVCLSRQAVYCGTGQGTMMPCVSVIWTGPAETATYLVTRLLPSSSVSCWRFLPSRRYASACTSYGPVSVCLTQVGVLSKRLNESSWVLAWELFSTCDTLCSKEILVPLT